MGWGFDIFQKFAVKFPAHGQIIAVNCNPIFPPRAAHCCPSQGWTQERHNKNSVAIFPSTLSYRTPRAPDLIPNLFSPQTTLKQRLGKSLHLNGEFYYRNDRNHSFRLSSELRIKMTLFKYASFITYLRENLFPSSLFKLTCPLRFGTSPQQTAKHVLQVYTTSKFYKL